MGSELPEERLDLDEVEDELEIGGFDPIWRKRMLALVAEVRRLRDVLREIAKKEGAYSRIPIIHAGNTIEAMEKLAVDALKV